MELTGKIHHIMEAVQLKPNLRKREFVVEYADNPQYPQYLKFELFNDRCDLLNDFQVGQEVALQFNLRGREWTNPRGEKVYITTLEAWQVQHPQARSAAPTGGTRLPPPDTGRRSSPALSTPPEDDDMPF